MKKRIIFTIVGLGIGVGVAGVLYFKKKKSNGITTNENINDESPDIDTSEEIINPCSDIEEDQITTVIMDDDDIIYDTTIEKFEKFLITNGIDPEEAESICETIKEIRSNLCDQYKEVKEVMINMMQSGFDIEESRKFDKENFIRMYSSFDPCQLFITNGFKIMPMGPDYQDKMMSLGDALSDLKDTNLDEALEVLYDIYHTLNEINTADITPETYEEKFKIYVDRYVKDDDAGIDDSNINNYNEVED